jgi:hypothetical protein
MKYRRLLACMAALALGGGLGMIATTTASAAPAPPLHAQPQLHRQVGNGNEEYLYDETIGSEGGNWPYVTGPDVNGDQAYFVAAGEGPTWFELEQTATTYDGIDTYWLCSNGSSHHCLQDEDGPVDVEDKAGTSGQYWYFLGSGEYEICNYYWTVHSGGLPACMYDGPGGAGLLDASTTGDDAFELQPN